jgi:hypothetical protein
MKTSILALVLACAGLLSLTCTGDLSGPGVPPGSNPLVQSYRNVPWRMVYARTGGEIIDLSATPPFILLLNDTLFFGRDGCNWYWINFVVRGDSFQLTNLIATEMACGGDQFSADHLVGSWNIVSSPGLLTFTSGERMLQFASRYTHPLDGNPLVAQTWRLEASNDTVFHAFLAAGYLPRLALSADRSFTLQWDLECGASNRGNRSLGYFGCDAGNGITFWEYNSGVCAPPPLPPGYRESMLASGILAADSYSAHDSTATLFRSGTGTFYTFTLLR